MKLMCILLGAGALSYSQTKVNLPNQSRNMDFAAFPATRPWKTSSSLPAACQQGEALFLTTGAPGQQLYLCSSTNIWAAVTSTSLQDFQPIKTASGTLTIGPNCTASKPCRARIGNKELSLPAPATMTLGGTPSSGVIFVWIDEQGMRAGHSGPATMTCNNYCDVVPGAVTGFPVQSLPLAAVSYLSNVVDTVTGDMDARTYISTQQVQAGSSANLTVTTNGVTGAAEIDLSSTIDLGGFVATRVLRRGTLAQRPATCAVGDLYHQTDSSAGIYECLTANQWRGPLAPLSSVASMESRVTATAQTGDAAASTLLAAGHAAGWYRVCVVATITTGSGSGTLDLPLSWRSPAQGTNLTATLASISTAAPTEGWGCRIIRSTGAVAATVDPSDAGAAQYDLLATVERLQ